MDPIFTQDIPSLYGNEVDKVTFHHDKASSHTSHSTTQFLADLSETTKIKAIPVKHIPVKSPDVAPMNFCVFGFLKRALARRKPSTLEGLWKVVQDEWEKLSLLTLR